MHTPAMITRREILRRLALGGLVSPMLLRRARAAYGFASASSQYLEAASSPISTYPLTIAGWVKLANKSAAYVIAAICTNGGNARHQLYYDQSLDRWVMVSVNSAGSTSGANGSSSPAAGTWAHVAGTIASSSAREIFVDGASQGTSSGAIITTGLDRVVIGARRASSGIGGYMNGDMASVGMWSAVLSAAEIASLADAVSPMKVRPQSLRVYHPLIRNNVAPIGPAFTAYNSPTVAAHPRIYR